MNFDALKAPFAPEKVHWRVGSMTKDKTRGMALAYIDARDVMERLDAVCGPAGWQCRYSHAQGTVVCEVGLRIGNEWIWKADGAGATNVEAEKGSLSDSFKRAAVRWGIGRYLYHLPSPWVALDEYKRIEKDEYTKLRSLLTNNGNVAPEPERDPPQEQSGPPVELPQSDEIPPWWTRKSLHLPVKKDANDELDWKGWGVGKLGFIARISRAPRPVLLDKLLKDNLETLEYIAKHFPDMHKDIQAAVRARHKELQQENILAAE